MAAAGSLSKLLVLVAAEAGAFGSAVNQMGINNVQLSFPIHGCGQLKSSVDYW